MHHDDDVLEQWEVYAITRAVLRGNVERFRQLPKEKVDRAVQHVLDWCKLARIRSALIQLTTDGAFDIVLDSDSGELRFMPRGPFYVPIGPSSPCDN